ncbi:MAG: LytTR family DNA-binding domain-containing protein [Saprospiraceae bacterium]
MTHKIVIIEDEPAAVSRLSKMLNSTDRSIEIISIHDSVESSVDYFQKNPNYDLIFMDIQLGDGISFDIFKEVNIDKPIIFTTAYDEYAIKAFKVNSIDYLLKPIDQKDLNNAVIKYYENYSNNDKQNITKLINAISQQDYKKRFLVKNGKKLIVVPIEDVSYFFSEEGYTFLSTKNGFKYIIDYSIDQLESLIDYNIFHRINRKVILTISSLNTISEYFNSRLKLQLYPKADFDVIVSRERVKDFKTWLRK